MRRRVRTPPRAASWSLPLTVAIVVHLAVSSGCGESGQARRDVPADVGTGGVEDAAPPAARELPRLGPSGLESIEIVTGGASATDSLPLVIALHDFGVVSRMVTRSADKVAALTDEIAASRPTKGKAILTGISQGGMIAFVAAARQPERVGAVVPVSAWLPQFAWPDEESPVGGRPIVRALSGADDEHTKATDVRRCVVKLRMLKLDATARLYADTGHVLSPAMTTDLFRMLSWLVAGTEEPPPCEPCPGESVDPEACSRCPAGPPAPEPTAAPTAPRAGATAPATSSGGDEGSSGPDVALGRRGTTAAPGPGTGGASGSPSREEIQRAFRRNMAPIRFCHERQLETHPGLSGRVSIRFVIAPDGTVSTAQVATSTVGNDAVAECVRRAVTRVRFPRPQGGGSVTVTYPFMFAAPQR